MNTVGGGAVLVGVATETTKYYISNQPALKPEY